MAATLGLALAGAAIAPASATGSGVITREFGRDFPTYSTCMGVGASQASANGADDWECYRQSNGRYTGYLYWYV